MTQPNDPPDDYVIRLADLRAILNNNTDSLTQNLSLALGLICQRIAEVEAVLAQLTDVVASLASRPPVVEGDEWKYADPGDEGE